MKAKGHINGSLVLIAIILLLVAGITYAATQIQRDDIGGSFVVGSVLTPQETILLYDELGPSTSDLVELSFGTGDFDAFGFLLGESTVLFWAQNGGGVAFNLTAEATDVSINGVPSTGGVLSLLMGPAGGDLLPAPENAVTIGPDEAPVALEAGLTFLGTPAELGIDSGDTITFTALFTGEGLFDLPSPTATTVTVVFGGAPENLGVYGTPGCAIIPQHFVCQDAVTDVLAYIDSTTFEVVPLSGVQGWEQIDEFRWRFTLTPGVKFHNGEEWNAAAARAGIDWAGDLNNFQSSAGYTGSSHGDLVDGNDLQVDAVCDEACPIFPRTAFLIGFQAPEWYAGASEEERTSTTVGFGPYTMFGEGLGWTTGDDDVTLEKYSGYVVNALSPNDSSYPTMDEIRMVWNEEPSVRAAMVAAGEADWAFDLALGQQDDVPVFDQGGAAETFVNVFDSIWHPELSKTLVRQALAYATDCEAIVEELYDNFYTCQGTYAPPGTIGVTTRTLAPYPFDPDLAQELLEEANYDPANEVVINVFAGRFFRNVEVAEAQAQNWRDVGVTVVVENLETALWLDVARTGCGRAIDEFADLENPPEDFCLSLPPGPPLFASPNSYQLNPSLETLDFGRATNRMNCLDSNAKFCDTVSVQPLIGPALAASMAEGREALMTELVDIAYDEMIVYTYFNAEVFYGVSADLNWTPRFDRRLRVNQWSFSP